MERLIQRQAHAHADGDSTAPARFVAIGFIDWMLDVVRRPLAVAWSRHRIEDGSCAAAPTDALDRAPIVVVEECASAVDVVAVDGAARAFGIRPGISLAEAESICPDDAIDARVRSFLRSLRDGDDARWRSRLHSIEGRVVAMRADPRRGRWMLARLAECLARWIPAVMPDGDGQDAIGCVGLVGDLTGCGPLFRRMHGTEQELMRRVHASLSRRGFRCRLATASTIGTAVALARSGWDAGCRGTASSPCRAVPQGREADALDPLPVGALRIAPEAVEALRSVEVVTVGQLSRLGRQGVAARWSGRFGDEPESGATGVSASTGTFAVGQARNRRGRRTSRNVAAPGLFDADAGQGLGRAAAGGRSSGRRDRSGHDDAGGASTDHPVSSDLGARFRADAVQGVLRRLDQALGVVPERIEPLRAREPLVLVRDFDSPVVRMEDLFRAMGVLVVGMSEALYARREGLRHAVIALEHARFPADTDLIGAPRSDRTLVELRPGRATARRMHLWSLVQPKIETVSLAYGIERVEWRIIDAARLRFRQLGMPLGRAADAAAVAASCATRDALRDGCRAQASLHLRAGGGRGQVAEPALAEWIDLVRARLGESSVTHPSRPERPWSIDAAGASRPPRTALPAGRHLAAAPWPCRPTIFFEHPERAAIGAVAHDVGRQQHAREPDTGKVGREVSGRCSHGFSVAMASRRPWHDADMPPNRSGVDRSLCESSGIVLRWRAGRHRVVAVEGWERVAGPWWMDAGASEIAERQRCASEIARHADADALRRSTAVPEGRLLSRVCTEEGMWLMVRWPMRFGAYASGGHPSEVTSEAPTQPPTRIDGVEPRASRDIAGPRMHATHGAAPRQASFQGWMRACMHAIERGVEVEVLGVWA